MTILALNKLILLAQRSIRWLVGGWSLQRKGMLFLGVAPMVPIGCPLVFSPNYCPRPCPRHHAQIGSDHARSIVAAACRSPVFAEKSGPAPWVREDLRSFLRNRMLFCVLTLWTIHFSTRVLMLDQEVAHLDLGSAKLPSGTGSGSCWAARLYRQRLNQKNTADAESTSTETSIIALMLPHAHR